MLPYATAFDTLDPKEGYCVEYFNDFFPGISDRARKLLAHRTDNEIRAAASIIDWLTNEEGRELLLDSLLDTANALDKGSLEMPEQPTGPAQELGYCLARVELDDKEDFPDATKAEFFAVLALCLVGLACEEQAYLKRKGWPDFHTRYWHRLGAFAIDAMEAVVTAEYLAGGGTSPRQDNVAITHAVKKHISLQNSRAARKRYEPVSRLKAEFVNWYRERQTTGEFHSKAQAAQRFYDTLPPDKKGLLRASNAVRTLTDALREFLRDGD